MSFRTETDTSEIVEALLASGKRVCVPRVIADEMYAAPWSERTETNGYGIVQPVSGEDEPCEIAVVPLLAVDGEGYRLGYGGGYYDRYFAAHPKMLRVGLCYEGQAVERLPRDAYDLPLDAVVTECGVRGFRRKT